MTQTSSATGSHTTGTRKRLGLEYGQTVTLFHRASRTADGTVTGVVATYPNGWTLVDTDQPNGRFICFSHNSPVTVVR
jgi:hypothetical protein